MYFEEKRHHGEADLYGITLIIRLGVLANYNASRSQTKLKLERIAAENGSLYQTLVQT